MFINMVSAALTSIVRIAINIKQIYFFIKQNKLFNSTAKINK